MTDVMEILLQLLQDFEVIKAYILALSKSKLESFKESWIDGQEVMQTLHLSKRTLQTLRDSGTLPYSRVNGKFYYKLSDIEQLLEDNYINSKTAGDGSTK